jgi:uncharacterized phosphosugar-binding protein
MPEGSTHCASMPSRSSAVRELAESIDIVMENARSNGAVPQIDDVVTAVGAET